MSISAQNPDIFGDRQSGQDDCTQEVMACQDVSNIAKTSLGPVGLDQMGADDIGDVTIETDGATILRMLEVEQPAASVFDRIRDQATAWHAAASKNFKTSLGPVGLDRMGADDIGDVTIETDGATILRMLEVEQPAASVFDRIRDQATAWHAAASKNFKTSLGPVGLDRMGADDIGDVTIETDGATILRMLEVEQPAASVFDRIRDQATAWHAAASKNFKTSLGPVGLDRMGADDIGDVTIETDGATILRMLEVEQPAASVFDRIRDQATAWHAAASKNFKTSLGPVGLDRMGADDIGDVTIETDGATILRMLEVEQPAASVFDRIRDQATAWHAAASKNFKTSLGPVGLDRMGADDIGDVTIETDGATILRMLEVEQPAASVFDRIRDQATAWHAAASKNFKTSLGPVGLDRMGADDIGDVTIETDGATILRMLEVEQPAASVFDRIRDQATAWHAAASKNFKTSLGPVGLDRMGADDIGDMTIETDSATILRMLEVEQPAASVFDRIRDQATAWHAAASKNFKTSLGPVGLDRMGADDIGDMTIETDSATILRMLEVEQPAASVFDRIRDQATAWHAAASKNFKTSLGPVGLDRMGAGDIGDMTIETDSATILRMLEVEQPAASVFDRIRDQATAWHAAASKNFKTSLGPVGLDRMGADDIGDMTIETDSATILRMLEVEQPAASVFDRIRDQATAWHAAASKKFKTSLGPVGLDRMGADDIGDMTIETDSATILRMLEVEQPAASVFDRIRDQATAWHAAASKNFKTSLGPVGLDRMRADDIGDVAIETDAAAILRLLEVELPTAKMIYDLQIRQAEVFKSND